MHGPRRDPYAILGTPRGATRNEIAANYRRLAKAIHPDVGTNAATDMRDLNWAWHVLSDPARRRQWDAEHPLGGSHWGSSRTSAGWTMPSRVAPAPASWSSGTNEAEVGDERGRVAAVGCLSLMVLAVLVIGFVLIAALASGPPREPPEHPAQESQAP